jgi:histidinol-phosphatase (PHP family)
MIGLPADLHVHTQFSWDAPRGDMEATCRRALELGLPAIAFTEHADFVQNVHEDLRRLDVSAYLAEVERCRSLFPALRIMSGVELGEAHRFSSEAADVRAVGRLDRVLGSVHCFEWRGALMDASQLARLDPPEVAGAVRAYLAELLALVESDQPFDALAHVDYPKRYWPHASVAYRDEAFEEELRTVLRRLAARGSALEVNTTRGADPVRGLCPGPAVLRWWMEEGGRAVSFGSDSHEPSRIALGFELAAEMVEAAGFRPNDDVTGWWLR